MAFAPNFFDRETSGTTNPQPPVPVVDIATAASNPKAATAPDGMSATAHSLPDLIAADKYLKAQAATRDKRRGVRFAKIVPPGTAGN